MQPLNVDATSHKLVVNTARSATRSSSRRSSGVHGPKEAQCDDVCLQLPAAPFVPHTATPSRAAGSSHNAAVAIYIRDKPTVSLAFAKGAIAPWVV